MIGISYTVRAIQREDVRTSDGVMMQAKGTTIYLDYDPSGGGYPQWGTTMPKQTPYESADEALDTARDMDGMPWWNKPDMGSLVAVRLTHTEEWTAEDVV